MKTKETKDLEKALDALSKAKREYGCEEVTIGFKSSGHGDEIVDYMTMDAKGIFKCYELKVTLQDLKTDNKKSFYGDYNYLVVSKSLYAKNPTWANYIPPYCGILVGEELTVKKQAKKKDVSDDIRKMLEDSLLRSVFWKYENYKDAKDLSTMRELKKQIQVCQDALLEKERENERLTFTYHDYEFYYRKNHRDSSFTLEQAAKNERMQSACREKEGYTWIKIDRKYVCPSCKKEAICCDDTQQLTDYCPFCGADLRK